MTTKKAVSKSAPPKHLKRVNLDLDSNPKVDWDKTPVVSGVVKKIKEVLAKRKNSPDKVETRFAVVETESGLVNMWETAALSEFFDQIGIGSEIHVAYTGDVELTDNRTMRAFDAYCS